ncbi:MAG: hypothetical protein Kow00103_14900 [Candidatus Caldatribacteriota bacterium]
MKNRLYLFLIIIFLTVVVIYKPVFAHKVNIFAYVEGDKIYTESYFNDGKKCINSKLEVFDQQGNKLLEGQTDEEGTFSFEIPEEEVINTDLKIVLTASMGHRAEYIITSNELKGTRELIEEKIAEPISILDSEDPEASSLDLKEIKLLIEETLNEKLDPILSEIREIRKSQAEKISTTEIIGGLGYILGIFGIVAYFLSRKR